MKTQATFIVFDIDGTISDCSHRAQYANAKMWDEFHSRCLDDHVIVPIAEMMRELEAKFPIILLTGRNEKWRHLTEQWLRDTRLYEAHDLLLMRPDNDWRPDHEVKISLLEKTFGDKDGVLRSVWFVVDDRDSVVEGLRNYGLTVLQAAAGGF